jgi:phenol 2-monooxygenase
LAKQLEATARRFTPANEDLDSFIEPLLVFSGSRAGVEQAQIPPYFWPANGKWKMNGR